LSLKRVIGTRLGDRNVRRRFDERRRSQSVRRGNVFRSEEHAERGNASSHESAFCAVKHGMHRGREGNFERLGNRTMTWVRVLNCVGGSRRSHASGVALPERQRKLEVHGSGDLAKSQLSVVDETHERCFGERVRERRVRGRSCARADSIHRFITMVARYDDRRSGRRSGSP